LALSAGGAAEGHIYRSKTVTTTTLGDLVEGFLTDMFEPDPPKIPAEQAAAHARRKQTDRKIRKIKADLAKARAELEYSIGQLNLQELQVKAQRDEARRNAEARAKKEAAATKTKMKPNQKKRPRCNRIWISPADNSRSKKPYQFPTRKLPDGRIVRRVS
jgi:septal ring factor EnvC (AmiA/AmiB activator)